VTKWQEKEEPEVLLLNIIFNVKQIYMKSFGKIIKNPLIY